MKRLQERFNTLTLHVENAKHEYDAVVDNRNELEKCFNDLKSENEAFRLEIEEKCKALKESLNENAILKVFMNEKLKHDDHEHGNKHFRNKHVQTTCYECGRKGHITFIAFLRKIIFLSRRFGF